MQKITINKSQNADTRSATGLVSKEELRKDSQQHINDVRQAIAWMIEQLRLSAHRHDYTKLLYIDQFHKDFEAIQRGDTEDFKKKLWFSKYHTAERHHLTDFCPDDVNMFDILERIADIVMAGMARTGKVYSDTLPAEILEKAYKNTIDLLIKNTEIIQPKEQCMPMPMLPEGFGVMVGIEGTEKRIGMLVFMKDFFECGDEIEQQMEAMHLFPDQVLDI